MPVVLLSGNAEIDVQDVAEPAARIARAASRTHVAQQARDRCCRPTPLPQVLPTSANAAPRLV